MERSSMLTMMRKADLRISKAGVVSGSDGMDYGILRNRDFMSVDEKYISLDDLTGIEYEESTHILRFTDASGDVQELYGGTYAEKDRGVISLSKMPATISELNAIFPTLYPNVRTQLYYDELQERAVVNMAMFDRPDEGLRPINDSIVSIYYENLELKLAEHGFLGHPPSTLVRDNVLNIQLSYNKRNLFREWVESHEWDGVPRLRGWFRDTFGATAPPLEDKGLDDRYLGDVSEAWFIGAIKRMYSETKHEIVPVLIGDQGIGKGLALKYTAGGDNWYMDTNVNIREPERFLDGVRGNIIVEMSESTQIRSAESEALKAFISKSSDQIRKAYARFNERFIRHFIFVASSNLDNIFTDITGNRRFFPMYCNPSRATRAFSQDRSVGQYDVEQVWAEALAMYRKGHKWYMSEESAKIARVVQDYGTQENSNISVIDDWLDDPKNGYTEKGARINKNIIFSEIFMIDPKLVIPRDAENAFRAWANGQRSWTKISKSVRLNGKVCRAYERVYLPGDVRQIARLNIVDGVKEGDRPPADLVNIMRSRAVDYGYADTGDDFPTDGLDDSVLKLLSSGGYIYEDTVDPVTYKVGFLP